MLEAEYRHLTRTAPSRSAAIVTYGSRLAARPAGATDATANEGIRAYIEGNGRFQLEPRLERSPPRAATSPTAPSCAATTSRATTGCARSSRPSGSPQTATSRSPAGPSRACGLTDVDGQQPIVLPAIDARWRIADPIARTAGSSCRRTASPSCAPRARTRQRAFASAHWDRRGITPLGPGAGAHRLARGDVYHTNDTLLTADRRSIAARRAGTARVIGALGGRAALAVRRRLHGRHPAADARASSSSPRRRPSNLDIPNEDARVVDLEDSNLFALNRFPGYDRWEDGVRVTYGADWALDLPRRLGPHHYRPELSARPAGNDPAAGHRPFRPLLRLRRPDQRPHRPPRQLHPPLPARQGQFRDPPQRDRRDDRRPPDLCDDRLSPAQPRHRSVDRGSARPRGDPARRPGQLRPLLVDLRLGGHRSHQPAGGSAFAGRRLRAGPPPARHPLRRRLHRAWRDLAARL